MIRHIAAYAAIALVSAAAFAVHADEVAPAPTGALDNPLAAHPLAELAATRDRPLFTASRRPPAPPAVARVAPPPPPPPPPELALFGTLVDSDGASAIVRKGSDKPIAVRLGEELDGWAVTEIGDRQIVLALGDRSATFTMFNGGGRTARGAVVNYRPPPLVAVNAQGVLRRVRP